MLPQLFNASMRLASLGLKLLLTLYMAKYIGLTEMGAYGLVAAYSAIAIPLLGFRFDYVVLREIVNKRDLELAIILKDEITFYFINYVMVTLGVIVYLHSVDAEADKKIILTALIICVLESLATITSQNMNSLNRPILSNFLFFIRSALWTMPVMLMGWYDPKYRTAAFVFDLWISGILLSLFVQIYIWRNLPWCEALKSPMQWKSIQKSVIKTIPIWISGICAALAANIDRFIVENFLNRHLVGLVTFYASLVMAVNSLLASGLFAFKYPSLIELYKQGKIVEFQNLTKELLIKGSLSAAGICIAVGFIIPLLGSYIGRLEFAHYASTLWLMLFSMWLKISTEGLYYVQYARHQDRDIWIGNILTLIPAVTFNLILVPYIGLIGIGFSAVMSMFILGMWRIYSVRKFDW